MLPQRACTALRTCSRQHTRRIHSTTRHLSDEAPRRAGRKERSTLISNEVSKLRDQGPPLPAGRPTAPTTSTGSLDTPPPPSVPGRMGQNDPAEREGIAAQGVARPSAMTEPAEGGKDVLAASAPGEGRVAVRPSLRKSSSGSLPKAAGRAYQPVGFSKKELLRSGEGTATIAGKNFEGVLEDRVKSVVEPGRRAGVEGSSARDLQKREQGQNLRTEREDAPSGPAGYKARRRNRQSVVSEDTRGAIVGKLVKGRFDAKGLLAGGKETPSGPLEEIKKRLLMNGTYLGSDARKLVDKVQGFLTKEQWKKLAAAKS